MFLNLVLEIPEKTKLKEIFQIYDFHEHWAESQSLKKKETSKLCLWGVYDVFYFILLSFQFKNVPENATLKVDMLSGIVEKCFNESEKNISKVLFLKP